MTRVPPERANDPTGGRSESISGRSGPLRVVVIGAAGRMGRLSVEAVEAAEDLLLVAAVDAEPASSALSSLPAGSADVAVEFTRGDAPAALGREIERIGCAWVCGTTGLSAESRAALDAAARSVAILVAPNMSLGAAVLGRLCAMAAELLPVGWEMELIETHHGAKIDAPSGTAIALADLWVRGRGGRVIHGRTGRTGPRAASEVGIHAVRLPEGVGEHRILLGAAAESLELAHRALDRRAFAAGALTAARWLAGRPAGLYSLQDWVEARLARGVEA